MSARFFANRTTAGQALASRLAGEHLDNPVVLALPRGGVPVALEIARRLRAPLDLVLVRKVGVPGRREVAAAAVVDGGEAEIVYNREVMRAAGLDDAEVHAEAAAELAEIERRRATYLGGRRGEPLEGRTLVVVDDGIATGATMRAALVALRRKRPQRLIVAVPVAPRDVVDAIASLVDEVVCLEMPEPFYAVGLHYDDFEQLEDQDVITALDEAATFGQRAAAT
ncbi:MAG: phosphoribosyltransferase [Hyphomicrobiaceae bacterium]